MAITHEFPNENKVFLQNNRTDVFPLGNIWSTFNIDLQTNLGVVRVAPRLKLNTSTADDADLGCPVAFKWFDTKIFAICGTRIFANSGLPNAAFTEDASSGAQTDYSADESDMEIFNDALCATTTDALYSKATNGSGTGAWTSRDTLSTGTEHVVCYFRKFNRLYYTNADRDIISINTSWTTADPGADYALRLISAYDSITSIRSTSSYIWIGTINNIGQGARGAVYNWDGISAQPTTRYELQAQGAMALCILNDTPYVMDSNGVLSVWQGATFEEVGRLPFGNILPYNVADSDNERFIHPNGMYPTKNGTIRILINNRANTGNIIENMPSGVWEWSKEKGIVHLYSFTYNPNSSSTITDFGQNQISRIGALESMQIPTSSNVDGTLLAGATVYTNASSTTSGIFNDNSLDTIQKKGYIVSDWIDSDGVDEEWERLWPTFRKLLDSGDRIVAKYRIYKADPTYFDLTWTSTTTFTTTTNLTAYWTTGQAFGGEVEILRGTGSGSCAHITSIVNNAGTYTVTLDTVITGVTNGTASARAQNWIKCLPEITPTTIANTIGATYGNLTMGKSNSRVQIKFCFTFTGPDEFYRFKVTSGVNIKIE